MPLIHNRTGFTVNIFFGTSDFRAQLLVKHICQAEV